eukprot:52915-Eustigmatos_ZCMA.PRE.1
MVSNSSVTRSRSIPEVYFPWACGERLTINISTSVMRITTGAGHGRYVLHSRATVAVNSIATANCMTALRLVEASAEQRFCEESRKWVYQRVARLNDYAADQDGEVGQ